jgi:hypothetical protein
VCNFRENAVLASNLSFPFWRHITLPGNKDVYVVFLALFAHDQHRSAPLFSHQIFSNQTGLEINLTEAKGNTSLSHSHRLIMPEVLMKTESLDSTWLGYKGGGEPIFLFFKTFRPALGTTQHLTQRVLEALSQSVRDAHHSPPFSAEVKNVWNYASTLPHAFIACTWTAVLLPRFISLLSPTLPASNTRHALYWACLAYAPVVKSYITKRPIRHVSDLLVYTT